MSTISVGPWFSIEHYDCASTRASVQERSATMPVDSVLAPGIELAPTPEQSELRDRIAAFVANEILPREADLLAPGALSWEHVQELRRRARTAGVYGPQLGPEW